MTPPTGSEWGGGASWCCPSLSTSFALMVKECRRPRRRRRRRRRRPSAAVLHVSRPSFVQRRRRPTGSRSVGRGGCGFDANSCLSNVVWTVFVLRPADGGWANSPSSTRRKNYDFRLSNPRWNLIFANFSLLRVNASRCRFIPVFCFVLFSLASRPTVYHVTPTSCWIRQQPTPIVVFQVHSGKGSSLTALNCSELLTRCLQGLLISPVSAFKLIF